MSKHFRPTRRRLIKTALSGAAAAGLTILSPRSLGANERLAVAVIGCGGRGAANLGGVASAPGTEIVALCDVDDQRAGGAFKKHATAKQFRDFRKMFDAMAGTIDAVVVSTPDHTHAVAGAMAMRLGKHLYCEKPLTHSLYEARMLTELASGPAPGVPLPSGLASARKRLCTQMGTQIHAEPNYRRVVELVRGGTIGVVKEVHVWHPASYAPGDRPKETPPVPATLDWDLWLGPAPQRPYHPCYVPGSWRGWWDFATGGLGDFFCHYVDVVFWSLGIKHPTTVETEGPPVHDESCPKWLTVRYEFPAAATNPAAAPGDSASGPDSLPAISAAQKSTPVKLTWWGGPDNRPPIVKEPDLKIADWKAGVLFIGDKGMLVCDYSRKKLLPESRFADFKAPAPTIPNSIGHHKEWVQGCLTGSPTTCSLDYAGPLTEAALLATVSYRSGERIQWNAKELKAVNAARAARFIQREYRKGW